MYVRVILLLIRLNRYFRYIKEIHVPWTKNNRSMIVLDSFRGHLTEMVKKAYRKANTLMAVIPGGCTSKVQPLDVSINKPIKTSMRASWTEYIQAESKLLVSKEITKLRPPTKQDIIDWLEKAVNNVGKRRELVAHSFKVIGISNQLNGSEDYMIRDCAKHREHLKDLVLDDDDRELTFEGFTEEDITEAEERCKDIN